MSKAKRNSVTTAAKVEIPNEIVREAMAEPTLRGRVFLCSTKREALVCDGEVVGFVTPHVTPSGWRHGPIYVRPAYRSRGLVQAYYAAHPERDCVAFVADGNDESMAAHVGAGFTMWKRAQGGTFLRRPASASEVKRGK